MAKVNLQQLKDKAGEMALHNMWGENAYKINTVILEMDQNNYAACTRLAKYYKLHDDIAEAKKMYMKALKIDPESRGAINNLNEIERDEQENEAVDQIKTTSELFQMGQKSMLKGKNKLALKLFSKAYGMEPVLKHAVGLAGVYNKMGRHENIEELYTQLIEASHVKADVEAINHEFKALRINEKSQTKS